MTLHRDLFRIAEYRRPLYLERIDYATAKRCVQQWHYSHTCTSAMANYGVWEGGAFKGAILYSQGAASCIARPFDLKQQEVRELIRVALNDPLNPVSKIVAVSLRLFCQQHPSVKVVVSFADTGQQHNGTIYQAGNWVYLGSKSYSFLRVNGKVEHPKSLYGRYGLGGQSIPWLKTHIDPKAERVVMPPKHKYAYFFDDDLREQWKAKALPYPKSVVAPFLTKAEAL